MNTTHDWSDERGGFIPLKTVRVGGALAAGLGFVALLGWALAPGFLASLKPDRIPMAPATATLLFLYGTVTHLRGRLPLGREASQLGVAVNIAGALAAWWLSTPPFLGARPGSDPLGSSAAGAPAAPPVGPMSETTALCFVLASVSFLASLPSPSKSPRHATAAWWSACLLLAAGLIQAPASVLAGPPLAGASALPAATTSLAFLALGTALLALARRHAGPSATPAGVSLLEEVARLGDMGLRLATAVEQSPVSVVITDTDGRIEYVNPAFTRITGYTAEEALGGSPRILKSGRQEPAVYQDLWATIRAGGTWQGEIVNQRKDGSLYTQELAINPVRDATGTVTHFVAIGQDVTARKQAEAAALSAEARYRVLFEESPDGLVLVDGETGKVLEANATAHKQLGYTREEFAGLDVSDFEALETPEETRRHMDKVLAEESDDFETLQRTKNGEIRNVHVWVKRLELGGRPTFHCVFEDITERRRAEEALRENARELLDSQRAARLGSYRLDIAAGTWTSSPSLDEIFGIGASTFSKDVAGWLSIVHPDQREEMGIYLAEEVLGRGRPFDREYRIVRHDDRQERWVHGLGALIAASEGRLLALIGTIQDVTERRQAESALRANEERYRAVAESANEAIVTADSEGKIVGWNRAAERIFGYTEAQISGQAVTVLMPERYREAHLAGLRRVRSGGEHRLLGRPVEVTGLRRDGTEFPLELSLARWTTAEGWFVTGMLRDITERKESVAALHASERRYRTLFDRNLAGVYRSTLDGRILECNDAFARIFGYASREDVVGGDADALYATPDNREAFLESLVAEGVVINHEFEGRHRDGHAVWLLENAHLVAGDEPDAARIIEGTLLDITERTRLQAQLRQSQRIEAIGQLAGGVAHDFNNILGVITGYGELALRQLGPDDPVRARVDQMLRAAQRAVGLTRQLLAFSRKQILQVKALDLNATVADTHKMLGRLIGEHIEVVVRAAPGLGTVRADPAQVEQIVLNLAVNARDAMPKGGRLTLETANVDLDEGYCAAHPPATPGRFVMLAVSDTGTGMDQETQMRIFEPFFTTKPEGQGTGLGLATTYGIVKQSGGFIWVYSEPGRGTTFKVYLPRVDAPVDLADATPVPTEAPRGRETILLVEDTATLREVIRETLEERGYTVLPASDGEEALARARQREGPIDLLLTDVVMPKLAGGDLAKRLLGVRPEVRVLYMSGYTDGAISQQGVLGEGVLLLEKPFSADTLARAVRHALDRPDPMD